MGEEDVDLETVWQAGRPGFGKAVDYLRQHAEARISLVAKTDRVLMHGTKVLMTKNYIGNLSYEARKGMTGKGIWSACAPFGYCNVVGGNGMKTIAPTGSWRWSFAICSRVPDRGSVAPRLLAADVGRLG